MRPTCSGAPTASLRAAVAQATGTPRLLRSGSMGSPSRLGTMPPSTMPSSGGTAGTVTINAPVTAHNLTFNTSGYTVARTLANTLTLAGATPTTSMASGISATISSVIAGTAGLTKAGLGTLTVSGANTYTGATAVNAGTLQAGATNTFAPTSAFTIASGATLGLNNFNQTIGSLAGAGTVTNGGAANRTLTTGGDNTSTAFSGVIQDGAAGATNLTKVGTGTFTLSGANTYTGTTTISAGTLQIGTGGTTGTTGTGNITDNAALVINRSDTLTVGGTISGTGSLTQAGTGTLTLTGNNTYTGITTISAGTLQIGNGSTSGNIVGDIVNNAALVFNRSGTLTYGGVISGTGSLDRKSTRLNSSHVANTYTGGRSKKAGTLAVSTDANLGAASGGLTFGGGTL